jgi:hypothetical protein
MDAKFTSKFVVEREKRSQYPNFRFRRLPMISRVSHITNSSHVRENFLPPNESSGHHQN